MRPRRCAQERDCADALTSRSRVASPQAGPLLRRTRAHLAVVRVLPAANFARFPIDVQVPAIAAEWRFLHVRNVAHELMGQDTSDGEGRGEAAVRSLIFQGLLICPRENQSLANVSKLSLGRMTHWEFAARQAPS